MRRTSAAARGARCARLPAGSETVGGAAALFIYLFIFHQKSGGVADAEARAPPLTAAAQSFGRGVNTSPLRYTFV